MFRFCMESDIDIAPQDIAQSGGNPILLRRGQGGCGGHEHLLGPFGFIHQLGKGLGDIGQETDAIFFTN